MHLIRTCYRLALPVLFATAAPFAIAAPLTLDDDDPMSSVSAPDQSVRQIDFTSLSRISNERIQQDFRSFIPLVASPDSLAFAKVNLNFRDEGSLSFSGGLGLRKYLPEMDSVLGFHIHGDVTETELDHQIAQFGFGLDLFTPTGFDIHANLYLPETDPHLAGEFSTFGPAFGRGHSILQTESLFSIYERGRRGADVKLAFDLPVLNEILPARGHVGAYHFSGHSSEDLSGIQAGLTIQPFEGAAFGAEYYGDEDFYGDHWVFVAGISAPFEFGNILHPGSWADGIANAFRPKSGNEERENMRRFLSAAVDRRDWVLTEISDPFLTEQKLNLLLDNVIFVNNGGARSVPGPRGRGRGTFENPANTIQHGVNRSAAKFGNNGNIVVAGSNRAYREDIVDAGKSVRLFGGRIPVAGGRTFQYGNRPTIDGGIAVIDVDTFSMENFRVINGAASFVNPDAIFAANVSDVSLIGNRIINASQDAIDIESDGGRKMNVVIQGNRIRSSLDDGIDFDLTGTADVRVRITDNILNRPGDDGIQIELEDNSSIRGKISDNRVNGTDFGEGLEIDQDDNSFARLRILRNVFRDTDDDPLDIDVTDNSVGLYQVAHNELFGDSGGDIIEIDSDDTSQLQLQFFGNTLGNDALFREQLASSFLLEDTLNTNTLSGGATFILDPTILPFVPFGSTGFSSP